MATIFQRHESKLPINLLLVGNKINPLSIQFY